MLNRQSRKQRLYRTRDHLVVGVAIAAFSLFLVIGTIVNVKTTGGRVGGVLICLAPLFVSLRLAWAGVRASSEGIHVSNILSSFDLSWSEIRDFRVGRWNIYPYVCLIDLEDGTTKHAFGIQERTNFPNGAAEALARELREELALQGSGPHAGDSMRSAPGFGRNIGSAGSVG